LRLEYPTPDTIPTGTTCRSLFIPDEELFIGAVLGALYTLTQPENWQKMGDLTEQESADAMIDMFDKFSFKLGVCRMVGEIVLWAGSDNPDDSRFLLCDGTHISSEDYPDLYAVIGTQFGGSSALDFALPDLRGKVAIGQSSEFDYATSGGEQEHTLDTSEMPSHDHIYTPPIFNVDIEAPGAPDPLAAGIGIPTATSATGGGAAHNNMQPYLTLNYYIAALP